MQHRTVKMTALSCAAFLAALCSAPAALASVVVPFHLNGLGVSGNGSFTIQPNVSPPDHNPACGTAGNNPCRSDPPGAWQITGVTGTFTDERLGIFNAAITGLIPINPADEMDPVFDPLVPSSLSFIPAGLSYNNLYFPAGFPIDCAFPFHGTYLDVFGTAFTIAGGFTVNFWGDGNYGPGGALTYGVGVTQGANILDYRFAGIPAPEPLTLSLFAAGLAGAGAMRRRRKNARRAA